MVAWLTPHEWEKKEAIDKDKLNALSDNLRYIYNPASGSWTLRGSSLSAAAVTATTVTGSLFTNAAAELGDPRILLNLSGERDVECIFSCVYSNNTLSAATFFSFSVVPLPPLAFSLTNFGFFYSNEPVVGNFIKVTLKAILEKSIVQSLGGAGLYRFDINATTGAGIATLGTNQNNFMQFKVSEI